MKKVLFATTALIATAGVASADIAISGDGRMGLVNTESATAGTAETKMDSRIRITFTASGVTDGGLAFGGSIRADNAPATNANGSTAGTNGGVNGQAGSVFISGAFGKITMGDISSAQENAIGNVAGVGYTGLGDKNESDFIGGGDDEGVAYAYTINGLSIHATAGQRNDTSANDESGFALAYDLNGVTVAAGVASDGNVDQTAFGVAGSFAGLGLRAVMIDQDNHATAKGEVAISATYAVDDALTLTAFTRSIDNITGADTDYTGVGFAYNLGGGASVKGGYVADGVSAGLDRMDLGLTFSF